MAEKMRENASDHQALLDIQELMDGVNWSPDTLEAIAKRVNCSRRRNGGLANYKDAVAQAIEDQLPRKEFWDWLRSQGK